MHGPPPASPRPPTTAAAAAGEFRDHDVPDSEKLHRLQAITDAALSHLGLEELLAELLDRIRDLLRADTAAILLLDPAGTELIATAASGLEQEVHQGIRLPVGRGFAGTVAERGVPVAIEQVDHTNVLNPVLLAKNVVSVLGAPMINAGRVIGVLHIGTLAPRVFTADDIELLQLVADRATTATQARLSRLDRAAALALQRSLLPGRLPAIPGLDLAARYVPGAAFGVGGDWYDVFALPGGHVGVAIGDVAGNGLRAAVVMGRIRSALRAYALETTDPADVLTRLDRKVQLFEPGMMATVIYAVLDPGHADLALSNAGHPPPVTTEPTRPNRLVPVPPDLPIGAHRDACRRTTRTTLEPGGCLFFYTDGLIERRDRLITDGIDMLVETLTEAPADTMCGTAMSILLQDRAATDDVAVLAVRRTPTVAPDARTGDEGADGSLDDEKVATFTDPVSPATRLVITVRAAAEVRVCVAGEVDASNAARLNEALDEAIATHPHRLVVDLAAVTVLASAGVSALIRAWNLAASAGVPAIVTGSQPAVRRVLEVAGVLATLSGESSTG
jgi:phosphoserine phosphatase RsbU/P